MHSAICGSCTEPFHIFEQMENVNNITKKSIDDVFSDLAGCILDSTLTWCLAHLIRMDISTIFTTGCLRRAETETGCRQGYPVHSECGVGRREFVDLAVRDFGMKVKLFQSGDEESSFADGFIEKSTVKGKPLQGSPWKKRASRAKVLRLAADHDTEFFTARSDEGG